MQDPESVVTPPPLSRPNPARAPLLAAGVVGAVSVALLGMYATGLVRATASASDSLGARLAPDPGRGRDLRPSVTAAATYFVAESVTLLFEEQQVATTWDELGLAVDTPSVARAGARLHDQGSGPIAAEHYLAQGAGPVPVSLDRGRALLALAALKETHDRSAQDARLDLEARTVVAEMAGVGLDVYASLHALEQAARSGLREVTLVSAPLQPSITREKLGDIDIANVLGFFETKYPPGERDRNHNLKTAAEKVHGFVLLPGQTFSFNAVVGDRTERQGYRVAHVIQAGEMIDGLAGGACQISSTLHGAAFFAGLGLESGRPHSRPSAYITMGMDATVVYPAVDLKLSNPYEFPVVIRYVVSQGTVRVEILGKKRPWDKIIFERTIKKELPYNTERRPDHSLPVGTEVVDQHGFPGYELIRRRLFMRDGKAEKIDKRQLAYPPTTQYVRVGTNTSPRVKAPPPEKHHGPKKPEGETFSLAQ